MLADFPKDFSELHLYVLVAREKGFKAMDMICTYNDIALAQ